MGAIARRQPEIAASSPVTQLPYRLDHQRLLLATRAGRLGIWDYDIRGDLITCDERWLAIMGLPPDQPTRSIGEYRAIIHPDDVQRATEVPGTARMLLAAGEDYGIEYRIIRPDGEVRWVRSMASIIENAQGEPVRAVGFVSDITEARLAEERLERINALLELQNEDLSRQVMVDPLTGIANRRRFDQELLRSCAQARRSGGTLVLAMIDVDHFKAYNDHLGHVHGDQALRAVAEVIAGVAWRPYDLAARYGGEEFALILPDNDDPAAVLRRIGERLAAMKLPHPASDAGEYLTVSCGCAVARAGDDISPDTLLVRSDEALYRAKQGGRNRFVVADYSA
jgi:diguanylate cyclase (GGDEF)-like protein/PAS domain S-box-containing protein